ncbi:helix-turn-helix domain-containing protein [Hymenobacter jeollabukensis]|uniref:Helix-turn-helix transcriptional regulator n=1 Tax=Hymenobacter jeollabukensis TaxID=2025313 RepID=A0A5R8WVU4_9BACT|nr:helix-turn-helix transcriptional regulator [Hymenobacter jeollabukensis]TLM96566.1 helix-turn-helix transcriptional regulator [Hymenobacter jeollabukensis]
MFSADRILTIRKSRGLSQEMLAEQSGVSLRTIQRVEQGDTVPRGHTLQALAAALGVTLEAFRDAPAAMPAAPEVPAAGAAALPEAEPSQQFIEAPTLAPLPARRPAVEGEVTHPQPLPYPAAPTPVLRPDPQFLQLLNLSALSFLLLPLLNIVLPLRLWRARRHEVEHAAEVGRRVLGFQILWQVSTTLTYLLLVLAHWVAARYFQAKLPGTFLGVFIVSYVLNVLVVGYEALRLRRGRLDIYPIRL